MTNLAVIVTFDVARKVSPPLLGSLFRTVSYIYTKTHFESFREILCVAN
jgi:hypothetical protein